MDVGIEIWRSISDIRWWDKKQHGGLGWVFYKVYSLLLRREERSVVKSAMSLSESEKGGNTCCCQTCFFGTLGRVRPLIATPLIALVFSSLVLSSLPYSLRMEKLSGNITSLSRNRLDQTDSYILLDPRNFVNLNLYLYKTKNNPILDFRHVRNA